MVDAEVRTTVVSAVIAAVFALANIEVFALVFSVVALVAALTALHGQRRLERRVLQQQDSQLSEVARVAEQRDAIEERLRGDGDGA